MQGQDDNDATLRPLRDVHAINSRIEFGSVPISPVEVRIQILLPSVPQCSHDPFLRQTLKKTVVVSSGQQVVFLLLLLFDAVCI